MIYELWLLSTKIFFRGKRSYCGRRTDNGFSFGQPKMYFTNKKKVRRVIAMYTRVYNNLYMPRVNGPVKKNRF